MQLVRSRNAASGVTVSVYGGWDEHRVELWLADHERDLVATLDPSTAIETAAALLAAASTAETPPTDAEKPTRHWALTLTLIVAAWAAWLAPALAVWLYLR